MALAAQYQRTRLMWYHDAIIDFMIANPGASDEEIGHHVRRGANTIYLIRNSDMFKARWAARRHELTQKNDLGVIQKTHRLLDATLDAMLDTINKKKDTIPLGRLESIANSSLKALGYGAPEGPATGIVQVNNTQNNTTVVLPSSVSQEDILQARMAIRQVEQGKLNGPLPQIEAAPVQPETPPTEAEIVATTLDG